MMSAFVHVRPVSLLDIVSSKNENELRVMEPLSDPEPL